MVWGRLIAHGVTQPYMYGLPQRSASPRAGASTVHAYKHVLEY